MLKHTPERLFNGVGQGNYRCIKKMNYELADILNFEPEFRYSDVVVISCGVNDLARYGRRSHVLADLVTSRFTECCENNRETTFMFTSILSTSHEWLNSAIGDFNRIMFELSIKIPNFLFFDSHSVLLENPISSPSSFNRVIKPDDDGVHITFGARRVISDQLVNAVDRVVCGREGRSVGVRLQRWQWPLRATYKRRVGLLSAQLANSVPRGAG